MRNWLFLFSLVLSFSVNRAASAEASATDSNGWFLYERITLGSYFGIHRSDFEELYKWSCLKNVEDKSVVAYIHNVLTEIGISDAENINICYTNENSERGYSTFYRSICLNKKTYELLSSCLSSDSVTLNTLDAKGNTVEINVPSHRILEGQRIEILMISVALKRFDPLKSIAIKLLTTAVVETSWHLAAPLIGAERFRFGVDNPPEFSWRSCLGVIVITLAKGFISIALSFPIVEAHPITS